MSQLFANNVEMQLASNLGANDTSFTVVAGQGSQCPTITANDANFMLITFTDKNGNKEIVKVIEHLSGSDVFTIGDDESVPHVASVNGRAYEETFDGYQTALAIVATDAHKIRMPITAKTFQAALGFAAVTASANEIDATCKGNTATAEELSELHGAGTVKADFQTLHASVKLPLGYLQRPKFSYSGANIITIGPGVYHHSGTTEQIVYWNSTLTKTLTVTGTRWYYLYLSDSSIITNGPLLTADQIFEWPIAPVWSDAKHGWYNGNDRCIFAVRASSGSICRFTHDGGDLVLYGTPVMDRGLINVLNPSLQDITVPGFCTRAECHFYCYGPGYLCAGPSSSDQVPVQQPGSGGSYGSSRASVHLSSSQVMTLTKSTTGEFQAEVDTVGWHFPVGM